MSETPERVGQRRPGGRSARVRRAVLDAAVEVLAELGYEAFSIEEVASRAGVHKTTVYRRWPSRNDLISEATRERSRQHVPVPDTGSLEGDLAALARAIVANIGSPTGASLTRTLVAAAAHGPEAAERTHAFWAERLRLTGTIVERAIERGEVPAGTDPTLVVETLIGPLYVRLLLPGERLDAVLAERVAALVAAGAATDAGGPATASSGRGYGPGGMGSDDEEGPR